MTEYEIQLIGPGILMGSHYWPKVHAIILQAFKPTRDDWPLPKAFQCLSLDVEKAGYDLCEEVGPDAMMALAFDGEEPIACAGIQKFKAILQHQVDGTAPPTEEHDLDGQKESLSRWEIMLVTTSQEYRKKGIAGALVKKLEEYITREQGTVQLMVGTIDEISGEYWRKLGFATVPEHCITLPKGFSHVNDAPDEQRLEKDVLLWTGQKVIELTKQEDAHPS
jgi:GNAT superfamily N-acetyltransferase